MPDFSSLHRFIPLVGASVLAFISLVLMLAWSGWFAFPLALFGVLSAMGLYDVVQTKHSILRNYPVLGHMRFFFEGIRPEIRQYLIESDQDEEPFSRDDRSLVYQRAKGPLGPGCGSMMRAILGSRIRCSRNTSPILIFGLRLATRRARSPIRPRFITFPP